MLPLKTSRSNMASNKIHNAERVCMIYPRFELEGTYGDSERRQVDVAFKLNRLFLVERAIF